MRELPPSIAPEQTFSQAVGNCASLIEDKGWIELVYRQKEQLTDVALFNDETWVVRDEPERENEIATPDATEQLPLFKNE